VAAPRDGGRSGSRAMVGGFATLALTGASRISWRRSSRCPWRAWASSRCRGCPTSMASCAPTEGTARPS
jgi:hypothetical protein